MCMIAHTCVSGRINIKKKHKKHVYNCLYMCFWGEGGGGGGSAAGGGSSGDGDNGADGAAAAAGGQSGGRMKIK